jgi:TRAP transporter 4TM/12TM fusion protein
MRGSRRIRQILLILALGAALFHMYGAGFSPFTAFVQRPVHFALMAVLGILGLGMRQRVKGTAAEEAEEAVAGVVEIRNVWRWVDLAARGLLIAAAVTCCLYMVFEHEELVRRAGTPTTLDLLAGALAILVVLELTRRTTGWALVVVAVLALTYALAGPYLPGVLAHRGYSPVRLIEHLYLSTEGIWGVPLGVSADFVYLFVLFGAILDAAGGGELFIGLSSRIAGATRGGPAKTAALASALMGSLSGSAVANVVTTGSFTIPVMKRTGFSPRFAGAIEAAASSGGQLMPPIMGAGAFILATWTNIPYVRVALAAVIPAVLYYIALLTAIHFRALQRDLPASARGAPVILQRIHLLIPLGVIVAFLALGRSPMRAAYWGVLSGVILAMARATTRLDWTGAKKALLAAGSGTVQVAAACAAAGIVVGVASLTGIGLRMSEFIVTLSGGHLPVALVLTAIGAVILGMGLPTTAAYVVLAALGAPALTEMGVPLLPAHLFIFYFGALSNVTPPVALAAYAAAGIAGGTPVRTAVTALSLAITGFVVPFMFVYGPPLLMDGGFLPVILAFATAAIGVAALAGAVIGFVRAPLRVWERGLLTTAALCLLASGIRTDVVGIVVLGILHLFWQGHPAEPAET